MGNLEPLAGVVAFDALLIALLIVLLHLYLPGSKTRRGANRFPVFMGLSGFLVHAFTFFDGALLLVQVATICSIGLLYWLYTLRPTDQTSR